MNIINCFVCSHPTDNERIILSNRLIVCKQCFKKYNGFTCQYCGSVFLKDNYCENYKCCTYCANDIKQQKKSVRLRIHNYFFKPYPIFFKTPNEQCNLFLGIELEIGGVKDPNIVNQFGAKNQNRFFYIKQDSTIPQYGCEIVTYPATKDYHLSQKSGWKRILSNARKNNFKSFNISNCGLHIHVNRNFFNQQQIAKLDFFVNQNKEFFSKISRRNSDFSKFLIKPQQMYGKPINSNRHCALNLCNQNTIQFRTFKGTIKYSSIMAYIEIVYFLCMFVKENKIDSMRYQIFLQYISSKQIVFANNILKLKE